MHISLLHFLQIFMSPLLSSLLHRFRYFPLILEVRIHLLLYLKSLRLLIFKNLAIHLSTFSSTILSSAKKNRVKIRSHQGRRSKGRVVCFHYGDLLSQLHYVLFLWLIGSPFTPVQIYHDVPTTTTSTSSFGPSSSK
jgi:hypothetical protein